jgi:hypothetical protein
VFAFAVTPNKSICAESKKSVRSINFFFIIKCTTKKTVPSQGVG